MPVDEPGGAGSAPDPPPNKHFKIKMFYIFTTYEMNRQILTESSPRLQGKVMASRTLQGGIATVSRKKTAHAKNNSSLAVITTLP